VTAAWQRCLKKILRINGDPEAVFIKLEEKLREA